MRRASWILGIVTALVMTRSVASSATSSPNSTKQDQLQITGNELSLNTESSVICPVLPIDCCVIRQSGPCKVCLSTGC